MSNKNSKLGVAMTSAEYAQHWFIDSVNYDEDGMYAWMAEQAGQHDCVIEIGCGSGRSTRNILKYVTKVICIEANEDPKTGVRVHFRNRF